MLVAVQIEAGIIVQAPRIDLVVDRADQQS